VKKSAASKSIEATECRMLVEVKLTPKEQHDLSRGQVDESRETINELRRNRREAARKSKTSFAGVPRAT